MLYVICWQIFFAVTKRKNKYKYDVIHAVFFVFFTFTDSQVVSYFIFIPLEEKWVSFLAGDACTGDVVMFRQNVYEM